MDLFDETPRLRVTGEGRRAIALDHGIVHRGPELIQGAKYVLRTDVMFRFAGEPGAKLPPRRGPPPRLDRG